MDSINSADDTISSDKGKVLIKMENCTSEEENEARPNAVNTFREPQTSFLSYTMNRSTVKGDPEMIQSDLEANYCVVKVEEEIMQTNAVTPFICETCNATYDGLASYEVHLVHKHGQHIDHGTHSLRETKNEEHSGIRKLQGIKIDSINSADDAISSDRGEVLIKIENYSSEEENEARPNAFNTLQEPQTSFLSYTMNRSSVKSDSGMIQSDPEAKYCVVKVEEEMVQTNAVTPYTWETCNATYDGLASYEVHLEHNHGQHIGDGTHSERHNVNIHPREKPYKCDECSSSYCTKYSLKRHKIIHTGETPYKCDQCTSSFATSIRLKKHKMTHTGGRSYKCNECTISFTTSIQLKRHKATHSR